MKHGHNHFYNWLIASGIFLSFGISLQSQGIYLSTSQNNIYIIDSAEILTYLTTVSYEATLDDIALSSEGRLYGIAKGQLVEIDQESGEAQLLFVLPGGDMSNSLTSSNDNKLYMLGQYSHVLYEFDLGNNKIRLINYLRADMTNDMTFYEGNILFQSLYYHDIQVYDIGKETYTKRACHERYTVFHGMTNVVDSCGSERVYMINEFSRLYKLDSNDLIPQPLQQFPLPDEMFFGMASLTEHIASACYSPPEPVQCENTVGIKDATSPQTMKIYPNPASDFITIGSSLEWETLHISNISGKLVKAINGQTPNIDIQGLASGIYVIHLYVGGIWIHDKLIIK